MVGKVASFLPNRLLLFALASNKTVGYNRVSTPTETFMPKDTDITIPYKHPINEYIGQRIRHLREHRAIKAVNLSQTLGISATQLSNYEHGNTIIRMDVLFIIAQALDAPVEWFFKGYDGLTPAPHSLPPAELLECLMLIEQLSGRNNRPRLLSAIKWAVEHNSPMDKSHA